MSVDALPAQAPAARGSAVPASKSRWSIESAHGRTAALAFVALLVLVSALLRTRSLHVHYWIDEGLSVGIAGHPLSKIPSLLRQDGSPPLYYLLLHIWMSARGHGEVATHELSLLFSLVTIPVAYWVGTTLFNRRTAVICAILAALAPYLTLYAQETRMYSLVALLSLLIAASFVQVFVNRRRGYLPLFVLSLAAALYTHNWVLFLALMLAAAFLLCVRRAGEDAERRALWRDGLIAFAGVLVLYAPWLPTLLYQSRHTGAPWDLPPRLWSLSQGAYTLVGGRGAAVALLLGAGVGLVAIDRGGDRNRLWRTVECLLILSVGTLLVAWAYSKTTPAWAPRYLAVIVGPLIPLFALGLARAGRLGLVALALTMCFWILDPVSSSTSAKSNVAATLAVNRPHLGSDPVVLSTQPEQVPTVAYYMHRPAQYVTPLGPVKDPHIMDWRDALTRFRHASLSQVLASTLGSLGPRQRIVLVMPVHFPKQPQWMKLINLAGKKWAAALKHDPRLAEVSTSSVHSASIGSAVRISVFAQRSALAGTRAGTRR